MTAANKKGVNRYRYLDEHKNYCFKYYYKMFGKDDASYKSVVAKIAYYKNSKKNYMDKRLYSYVMYELINRLLFMMLEEGEIIIMPGIGNLMIVGEKKKPYIDKDGNVVIRNKKNMSATFKLWKKNPELRGKKYIYYMNEHTDGYYYRTHLQRNKNLKNLKFFKPTSKKRFRVIMYNWLIDKNRTVDYIKLGKNKRLEYV